MENKIYFTKETTAIVIGKGIVKYVNLYIFDTKSMTCEHRRTSEFGEKKPSRIIRFETAEDMNELIEWYKESGCVEL